MTGRFLGIFRDEFFEIRLGAFMLLMGAPSSAIYGRKFRPAVGGAHVHDTDGFEPGTRRLDPEQARWLAALDAAPELLLGRQQQVLVERVCGDRHLDPFAAAGDDRQHRRPGTDDPHVVLQLGHVLFRRRFFRKGPRQHEFGLEHSAGALNPAIQGCRHPALHGMDNPPLHVGNDLAGIALIPAPIELLGDRAKLNDQVAGQVLGLDFAALFPPEAEQGGLVLAHDDPGVRAANERAPITFAIRLCKFILPSNSGFLR